MIYCDFNFTSTLTHPHDPSEIRNFQVSIKVWREGTDSYGFAVDDIYCGVLMKHYSLDDIPRFDREALLVCADTVAQNKALEIPESEEAYEPGR